MRSFTRLSHLLVGISLCIAPSVGWAGQCIGAWGLERKVVRIERIFMQLDPKLTLVIGGGTGWFHLAHDEIITNAHVAGGAMRLSLGETGLIRIARHSADNLTIEDVWMGARLVDMDRHNDIARLKLERPYSGAELLSMRTSPVISGEQIRIAGFAYRKFSTGRGRIATEKERVGINELVAQRDHLLVSVSEKKELPSFFLGSSGSPLFDCQGLVVGIAKLVHKKCYENASVNGQMCDGSRIEDVRMPNVFGTKAEKIFNLYARREWVMP